MKSLWGAHVRTPGEDDLSEESVCEPLSSVPMLPSSTGDG